MKKRVLALLLVSVMALSSLTACGSKEAENDASDAPAQEDVTQEDTKEASEAEETLDITAPYDETVTVNIAMFNRQDVTFADGDDMTNNPWTRAYKDRYNIQIESAFLVEQTEYDTKVNLAIADGNLPDICCVNATQLQQLIEADMVWDLTDLYEQYASDGVKESMGKEVLTYESAMSDGKLYAIPQLTTGYLAQYNQIWIRKDWKENLDLEDPKTMDDVVTIVKAFSEEYGVSGMPVDNALNELEIIAPAWGAYPGIWVEDENGEIAYGSVQPEMKEALAVWAQWYQDGIIDIDFATTDQNKIIEDCVSGEVGIVPFWQWWGFNPGPSVVENLGEDAIFEAYAIPTATGEDVLHPLVCQNYGYLVVSKDYEHPEVLFKLINFYDYMWADSFGVEDPEFINEMFLNSMNNVTSCYNICVANSEHHDYEVMKDALASGDTSILENSIQKLYYDQSTDWLENKTATSVGAYLQQGSDKSAYAVANEMYQNEQYIFDAIWAIKPETIVNSGTTLDDILTEGFTKIIMGDEPIDYFDTLVESWMAAGGEQATIEANEMAK